MSYVLQLKGKLQELKLRRKELALAADAHIKSIKNALATASITPLHDIDADGAAYHASELRKIRAEHIRVAEEIKKIQTELGED